MTIFDATTPDATGGAGIASAFDGGRAEEVLCVVDTDGIAVETELVGVDAGPASDADSPLRLQPNVARSERTTRGFGRRTCLVAT